MAQATVIRPEANPTARPFDWVDTTQPLDPFTFVAFGATGDLAARKLFPALFGLWQAGYLPKQFAVVGIGRRDKTDDSFRQDVQKALSEFRKDWPPAGDGRESFLAHIAYHRADVTAAGAMQGLRGRLEELEKQRQLQGNRLFYLATDPEFFGPIVQHLAEANLWRREVEKPWARVVIEKPFGHDLASSHALDQHVLRFLRPDQVYRIDHYLGKETVQNLLAFRFGNAIFEPLFHRQFVDHVQITAAETVGVEGRGSFYDHAGALRDVVQNHLLQLLALVAMDPPATLKARDISGAKLKILRSLVPLRCADMAACAVRGQYGAGTVEGRRVQAYRGEHDVAPNSSTETFVALRAEVETWRWAGVPFFLRAGKCLPRRVTEIAVQFKLPPLRLFRTVECEGDFCDLTDSQPSVLAFRIQPNEGISLSFSAKRPGMQFDLHPVRFDFDYGKAFDGKLPEAYERLILDALRGDATLFMRSDEVEAAWEFVTPILEAWQQQPASDFPNYEAGTWGPAEADRLIQGCCQGGWRRP